MRDPREPDLEEILNRMSQETTARGHRKERVGEVVSNKMEKTIVVRVERRFRHPQFKKVVTSFKKLYAHDEARRGRRAS